MDNSSNDVYSLFYKGNTDLKKKGVKITYTVDQVNEVFRCYKDINHFLSNYVYIISLDEGKVLFKPYKFQKEMLKTFTENRFTICNLRTSIR